VILSDTLGLDKENMQDIINKIMNTPLEMDKNMKIMEDEIKSGKCFNCNSINCPAHPTNKLRKDVLNVIDNPGINSLDSFKKIMDHVYHKPEDDKKEIETPEVSSVKDKLITTADKIISTCKKCDDYNCVMNPLNRLRLNIPLTHAEYLEKRTSCEKIKNIR
ncbi:hypothetical protein V6O07_05320, partial [Arthrospira platensis SPKY2]